MSTVSSDYYTSLADLQNGKDTSHRKVSSGVNGDTVTNAGDTSVFAKATDSSMGKDQFLNLLVAQLKYQDPLSPAEDTQFVAQLAQFSQLEFTQNSSSAISALAANMQAFMDMQTLQAQSFTNASATPLLGKEVRVMEASFTHTGGERELNIFLNDGQRQGTVVIKDADGNTIAELDAVAESSKGGDVKITWDGINKETGKQYLGGKYTIEVQKIDGSEAAGYAYQEGTVSGVDFSGGGASVSVNGNRYGLGYLVSVKN
ncbi:basal-body rod modification protein FlgD [Fibrobacterales bacterium]|nr:basal-body rod modification protein FlgD [Fibrobacterales bacterium]